MPSVPDMPGRPIIRQQHVRHIPADFFESLFHGAPGARATVAGSARDERLQSLADLPLVLDDGYTNHFLSG
jgi:hypothetical protein